MSVKAMAWAFEQEIDDAQTKLVLLALCDHVDEDGQCWPSQARLEKKASCSHATLNRHLVFLIEMGLLERQRRGQQTTKYRIIFEKRLESQTETPENAEVSPVRLQRVSLVRDKPSVGQPSKEDSNAPSARAEQPREELFEFEPVDEPPKAKLFRRGKTALVSLGLSEERSGSVIGRWLKDKNDPVGILAAIEYAREQCAVSPVAYVTQILKGQTDGKAKTGIDEQIRELVDQARNLEDQAGIRRSSNHF